MTSGLQRWVISLALVTGTLAVTFLVVTNYFPGDTYSDRLSAAYDTLVEETTGRPFTDIMRERPALFFIPAIGALFTLGWILPRHYWARALYSYAVFGVGFIGGHVFW